METYLVSFLIGQAKTGIVLTRRNKMKGTGSTDVKLQKSGVCSYQNRVHLL